MGSREGKISLYEQRWGRVMRSNSAEKVAMLRAFATHERDPAVRNPDYLAAAFAGCSRMYRLGIRLSSVAPLLACAKWTGDRIVAGGYWAETARVKYYDEVLLSELEAGAEQVILLGAGLDSRAYRFGERLDGVRVFEVDHPATARHKRERVKATFGGLPPHVTYVAADLTESRLEESLELAGFDPGAPTLVLWIGVSMYLPQEAVEEVLAWAGGLPAGSSLAFDYLERRFFADRRRRRFGLAGRAGIFVGLSGERFSSGFDRATISSHLRGLGLSVKTHLSPADAGTRYLQRSDGRTAGIPFAYWGYLHAGVADAPVAGLA